MSWGLELSHSPSSNESVDIEDYPQTHFTIGKAKLLTLVALILPIYGADMIKLSQTLMAKNETYGALLLIGVAGVYILNKRHLAGQIIDLERPCKKAGLALLMTSVFTFVIGSYGTASLFLHLASLILFISSYLLIRMNSLLLEFYSPPLALIALLILAGSFQLTLGLTTAIASAMLASLVFLQVFLQGHMNDYVKMWITGVNMALYSFLKIYLDTVSPSNSLLVIISLSYLEVIISLVARKFLKLTKEPNGQEFNKPCEVCSSAVEAHEFCPYCGRNLFFRTPPKRVEVLGLVLVPVLLFSMTFTSIPTLTLADGGLSIVYLKAGELSREEISFVSQRWLLFNETRLIVLEKRYEEDLILREVLVPEAYPETKNYTVIVEVAQSAMIVDKWTQKPWVINDTKQMYLGGSIPVNYIRVFSGKTSLKVLIWTELTMVLIDGKYVTRTIAVSIFANGTTSYKPNPQYYELSEDLAFMNDAEEISKAVIDKISVSGSWNKVLNSIGTFLSMANEIILVVITVAILTSLALISKRDFPETFLLDFLPRESLNIILGIDRLVELGIPATSKNIFERMKGEYGGSALDQQGLLRELDKLEKMRLVRKTLKIRAQTSLSEWRLNF